MPPSFLGIMDAITRFIPLQTLYGNAFRQKYAQSLESQYWTLAQIRENQLSQLKTLIRHSYNNVPYYTDIFNAEKIKPEDIKSLDDIKKIPFLTKSDVRNNYDKMIAKNHKEFKPGMVSTSGSTGQSLRFLLDQQSREKEYALVHRQFGLFSKHPFEKIASIRGDGVHDVSGRKKRITKYNPIKKELQINSYLLGKDQIAVAVQAIKEYKPKIIKGFPSAVSVVAKYCKKYDIVLRPDLVLVSSESMQDEVKSEIESTFGCPVVNWYGASEYLVSAGQCESREGFHINEDYSICEILDENDMEIIRGVGRIVATGLYNFSMPFLRYEQEDYVELDGGHCGCKRNLRYVKSIIGRKSDKLISCDGREYSSAQVHHYWKHVVEKALPNAGVSYYQIIQTSKVDFEVRLCITNSVENVESAIQNTLSELLGDDCNFSVNFLPEIPMSEKWRHVKCEIDSCA